MSEQIIIDFETADEYRVRDFIQAVEIMAGYVFDNVMTRTGGLSPQEHLDALRGQGYVVKAWTRDDLESRWTELTEDHPELGEVAPEIKAHAIDQAFESGIYGDLSDCTDSDWIKVDMAIVEGLAAENITVPGLN